MRDFTRPLSPDAYPEDLTALDDRYVNASAPPPSNRLADVQGAMAHALDAVQNLGRVAADHAVSDYADADGAKNTLKEWTDIAYEMYALLCNSRAGDVAHRDEWNGAFARLRDRFHTALDLLPIPEGN